MTRSSRAPTPRARGRSPGGVHTLSPAELPDRPDRHGVGSRNPPAPRKLLPSSPHPLASAGTPEPSQRPAAGGFPEWGAVPKSALPPPPSCDSDLETESQMDAFARTLSGKGSSADPPPCSNETRAPGPQSPAHTPCGQPRAFAAPEGPTSLLGTHGRSRTAPHPLCLPSHPCVPTGPGPLGAGRAGLRARSQRLRLRLQLLPAPPPAQFLPPDSARRDGAGPAGPGGAPGPGTGGPLGGVPGGSLGGGD